MAIEFLNLGPRGPKLRSTEPHAAENVTLKRGVQLKV